MPIKQLQDVPVPKPELAEQNKISELFRQLDDTIALHQHHLDNHKELKSSTPENVPSKRGETLKQEVRFWWVYRSMGKAQVLNKVMSDFIVPM